MRRSPLRLRRIQQGFTLVELIITIVVMGILASVGSSMIAKVYTSASLANSSQASADNARYAIERLAREIREVNYSSGAYAISSAVTAQTNTMTFTRVINGSNVTVTIAKSGTNVTLGYSTPAVTSTLVPQASTFTLDFLQVDNTAATTTSNVRFVVITLTVTDAASGQSITERTRVALRNA